MYSTAWRQEGSEREAYEKSVAFKKGQRFRAGIQGRISVLARGRGMKRCLAEGSERFESWVGAAVLANNLMVIAALLTKRSRRRRFNRRSTGNCNWQIDAPRAQRRSLQIC